MSTASKIKSAIRSRGATQRGIIEQLAGVTEQLQKAEESSIFSKMKEEEIGGRFGTLYSFLGVGTTALESMRQKQELESFRQEFEQSLPEPVRKAGGVTVERGDKSSLMDVFTGTASLSDYLYGQEKYMLGERELGTKYDVAAMGARAKAMRQGDLLDQFFGGEPLPKSTISRELEIKQPSLDIKKLYGDFKQKSSMLDNVEGTLVESDGNIIPKTIIKKTKRISAEDYLKTGPPNAIREMIKSSYPRSEEVPSAIARDVEDYENEKLVEFIPDIFETKQEDALGPFTEKRPITKDNFRERASGYTFEPPKTYRMKSPSGGAQVLNKKIKDLKIAQQNLKELRPKDKFNRKTFEKLIQERTSELKSLISEIYNPELDIFYGDDSTTLRQQLGSDSVKFIQELASK